MNDPVGGLEPTGAAAQKLKPSKNCSTWPKTAQNGSTMEVAEAEIAAEVVLELMALNQISF